MIGLITFPDKHIIYILILEGKHPKGHIEVGIDINVSPLGEITPIHSSSLQL